MFINGKKFLGSFLVFLLLPCSNSIDTITPNKPLKDGDILVSQGESFALGFLSLTNSTTKRYVGIWYNKVSEQTVVWVLNRDSPLNGTTGILSINTNGNLALQYQNLDVLVWSTNTSETNNLSSAQLLDSGNMVLYNGKAKKFVSWQSFDYPTNTMLPNMKLGIDKKTGLNRFLTSWKSAEDPGTGEYAYKMDLSGSPQTFLYKGSAPVWRTGPWNGLRWSGVPEMTRNFLFNVSYINNDDEISVVYAMYDTSIFSMMMVNESGSVERHTWHESLGKWVEFWSAPKDQCDHYGVCGAFGNCDPNNNATDFQCTCLPGYEPKSARDWYLRDGSAGCVRKRGGQGCGNEDGFVKMERVKVPDTSSRSRNTRVDESIGMKACEEFCLRNCTCVGYTSADISKGEEGSGCISWHGEMIDIRQFSNGGQDLFIRVDAVELAQYYSRKKKRFNGKQLVVVIVASIATVVVLLSLAYWWVRKKKRGGREQAEELLFSPSTTSMPFTGSPMGKGVDESGTNTDLPSFTLETVVAATNNFSLTNKLGEGGFGSVYKGQLRNGEEVAIKRLSDNSGQGIQEFKNEVTLIAKLQHRNLVRLLGYCVEKREKMLIYEYMPNKGLDSFIFDKDKGPLVDWKKRFEITLGISRGMLYLHQDSRLRIIHRDLKASNVLLDESMNPKISDFGMARIFGGEQMEATTNRVVGTYGYMSPEYAMEGLFSIKSDVFSFGVLLLEIISGRKNSSYYKKNSVNLIGHVWDLWGEGRAMEIVDSSMEKSSYEENEVKRCIHIGLLCVQESAVDRPTMSEVAFMLCHDTNLPSPKQPAFIFKQGNFGHDSSSASVGAASVYEETITRVEGR